MLPGGMTQRECLELFCRFPDQIANWLSAFGPQSQMWHRVLADRIPLYLASAYCTGVGCIL